MGDGVSPPAEISFKEQHDKYTSSLLEKPFLWALSLLPVSKDLGNPCNPWVQGPPSSQPHELEAHYTVVVCITRTTLRSLGRLRRLSWTPEDGFAKVDVIFKRFL